MNLLDYFDLPIKKPGLNFGNGFLGHSITHFKANENISEYQIGLIGINDVRNGFPDKSECDPDKVRNYFYGLARFCKFSIIDFGNLKQGQTINDTYASVNRVVEFFSDMNVLLIFIGGTQELSVAIGESILKKEKKLEISFIDALTDHVDTSDFHSKSYLLHHTLASKKNVIKNLIGYQTYLASKETISLLKSNGYNLFRLGSIRNKFQSIEPILRDSDFISFDLSSVRQSDSPASDFKSPNGFYAEEACQLANICGLSDKVKGLHICGIDTKTDINGQSTHLMAQIIWHFILGLSNRIGEYPIRPLSGYKKIYVSNETLKHEFVFYKNEENNRFWVELPKNSGNRAEVISCAETDYTAVCNNEIPERIWKRISNAMK